MNGHLLDTNLVSEMIKERPNPGVLEFLENTDERDLYLSVLTIGELRKGVASLADGPKRNRIMTWLASDLSRRFAGRILPIDEEIAGLWGTLQGTAGRTLPVIDTLLAATAMRHDLIFVTRNVADVKDLGVLVLNPWIPGQPPNRLARGKFNV